MKQNTNTGAKSENINTSSQTRIPNVIASTTNHPAPILPPNPPILMLNPVTNMCLPRQVLQQNLNPATSMCPHHHVLQQNPVTTMYLPPQFPPLRAFTVVSHYQFYSLPHYYNYSIMNLNPGYSNPVRLLPLNTSYATNTQSSLPQQRNNQPLILNQQQPMNQLNRLTLNNQDGIQNQNANQNLLNRNQLNQNQANQNSGNQSFINRNNLLPNVEKEIKESERFMNEPLTPRLDNIVNPNVLPQDRAFQNKDNQDLVEQIFGGQSQLHLYHSIGFQSSQQLIDPNIVLQNVEREIKAKEELMTPNVPYLNLHDQNNNNQNQNNQNQNLDNVATESIQECQFSGSEGLNLSPRSQFEFESEGLNLSPRSQFEFESDISGLHLSESEESFTVPNITSKWDHQTNLNLEEKTKNKEMDSNNATSSHEIELEGSNLKSDESVNLAEQTDSGMKQDVVNVKTDTQLNYQVNQALSLFCGTSAFNKYMNANESSEMQEGTKIEFGPCYKVPIDDAGQYNDLSNAEDTLEIKKIEEKMKKEMNKYYKGQDFWSPDDASNKNKSSNAGKENKRNDKGKKSATQLNKKNSATEQNLNEKKETKLNKSKSSTSIVPPKKLSFQDKPTPIGNASSQMLLKREKIPVAHVRIDVATFERNTDLKLTDFSKDVRKILKESFNSLDLSNVFNRIKVLKPAFLKKEQINALISLFNAVKHIKEWDIEFLTDIVTEHYENKKYSENVLHLGQIFDADKSAVDYLNKELIEKMITGPEFSFDQLVNIVNAINDSDHSKFILEVSDLFFSLLYNKIQMNETTVRTFLNEVYPLYKYSKDHFHLCSLFNNLTEELVQSASFIHTERIKTIARELRQISKEQNCHMTKNTFMYLVTTKIPIRHSWLKIFTRMIAKHSMLNRMIPDDFEPFLEIPDDQLEERIIEFLKPKVVKKTPKK